MEWLEVVLKNPTSNMSAWILIFMAFINTLVFLRSAMTFIGNIFRSKDRVVERLQDATDAENNLQIQIVNEMAARRASDDEHKRALITLLRRDIRSVDVTTRDTNARTRGIQKEVQRTQTAIKLMYKQLQKEGLLP